MEWISVTTLFQILPFIYSLAIDHREQFTAITSNYHVVDEHHEKYQLLGGEWHLKFSTAFNSKIVNKVSWKKTIIDLT